jgi:hypothetical protein
MLRRFGLLRRFGACVLPVAVLALGGAFAVAPVASAASSGLNNELAEKAEQQEPEATTSTANNGTTRSSNSRTVIIAALGAAVALLIAIAFVIVRDARRVAPVGEGPMGEGGDPRRSAAELRKRRARAKAARQQRKRNR